MFSCESTPQSCRIRNALSSELEMNPRIGPRLSKRRTYVRYDLPCTLNSRDARPGSSFGSGAGEPPSVLRLHHSSVKKRPEQRPPLKVPPVSTQKF